MPSIRTMGTMALVTLGTMLVLNLLVATSPTVRRLVRGTSVSVAA